MPRQQLLSQSRSPVTTARIRAGDWWYTAGTISDSRGSDYFWFATIWSSMGAVVAKVNVLDLNTDRVVLSHEYLSPHP